MELRHDAAGGSVLGLGIARGREAWISAGPPGKDPSWVSRGGLGMYEAAAGFGYVLVLGV